MVKHPPPPLIRQALPCPDLQGKLCIAVVHQRQTYWIAPSWGPTHHVYLRAAERLAHALHTLPHTT